ncbi:hypothetical protein [Paenibacillus lemnae]|uniref:Uncharacterized protein n=1 Tax=Paenibacillus lemnae TaxID=1330551 RepID=A0A848M9Z0_PAELE|nr:hypothetical protein [Paenibacillus lemnae]NMO96304.1 hypothetical protein [Paenibacillus lemnae]
MKWLKKKSEEQYTDVSTVESQRNDTAAEEFPDGPYGSSLESSLGKSSPWREEQRPPNRFDYENRSLHEGEPRDYPGADHTIQSGSD